MGLGAAGRSETGRTVAWLSGYVIYDMPLGLSLSHIADCLNLLTDRPLTCSRKFLGVVLSNAQYLTFHKQSTELFLSTVPPHFQFRESPPRYYDTQTACHVNIEAFSHDLQLCNRLNSHLLCCPSPIFKISTPNATPPLDVNCGRVSAMPFSTSPSCRVKYSGKSPMTGLSPPTAPLIPICGFPSRPKVRH